VFHGANRLNSCLLAYHGLLRIVEISGLEANSGNLPIAALNLRGCIPVSPHPPTPSPQTPKKGEGEQDFSKSLSPLGRLGRGI